MLVNVPKARSSIYLRCCSSGRVYFPLLALLCELNVNYLSEWNKDLCFRAKVDWPSNEVLQMNQESSENAFLNFVLF